MSAEEEIAWLQRLVDILKPDMWVKTGYGATKREDEISKIFFEFSSSCYLDHTMRLVRDHVEKFDFSEIPRVHGDDETFDYDKNVWVKEGEVTHG